MPDRIVPDLGPHTVDPDGNDTDGWAITGLPPEITTRWAPREYAEAMAARYEAQRVGAPLPDWDTVWGDEPGVTVHPDWAAKPTLYLVDGGGGGGGASRPASPIERGQADAQVAIAMATQYGVALHTITLDGDPTVGTAADRAAYVDAFNATLADHLAANDPDSED